MMIYLPLLFFGYLFFKDFKKNGINPYAFILAIYAITAIGTVLIEIFNFYEDSSKKLPLGLFAPILYCVLLYICMRPFAYFKKIKIERRNNLKGLHGLVIFYMIIFLIIFFVSQTRTTEVLENPEDLVKVRHAQYSGDAESFYNHLSGLPRYICAICSILSPSTYIMIFLFVYSVTYLKNKWWYNTLILIPSFSPLLLSINIADRSQFIYWLFVFAFSVSICWKDMEKKTKGVLLYVVLIILGVFAVYFMAVTIARFAMRSSGAGGGMITYLGQNYINFCNWLNYTDPGLYFERIMPITGHYILPLEHIEHKVSDPLVGYYPLNGFSTFMGALYQTGGFIALFLIILLYRVLIDNSIKRCIGRYSFKYFLLLLGLSLTVVLGVFGHYYSNEDTEFGIVVWFIIGHILDIKNRPRRVPITLKEETT